MTARSRALAAALALLATAAGAWAQPYPVEDVPDALRPWVRWVLDGQQERLCPARDGVAICLWPGRLALAVTARGGSFAQEVYADRELELPLPGGDRRWPQGVRLDGRPAAVLGRQGRPSLRVTAGAHRVEGAFAWDRLPDSLPVPATTAIVDLTLEGTPIGLPQREQDGLLLLRSAGAASAGGENLELRVFRQLADGVPLWLETRLTFDVSGRAREVTLEGALPEGAAPVAVSGDLPARLDAKGRLQVQVRAGSFSVSVLARLAGQPRAVARPAFEPPWPAQEVWVFASDDRLRQVKASGAPPIDPSRTELPDEWRSLPAFLMEAGARLTLDEVRRGEPEAAPDQVALARTLWLDQDGRGFTVRDSLQGTLSGTPRLNLRAPGELGRVDAGGQGQLITRDPASGEPGVELRQAALRLTADSRLPRAGALPAAGWTIGVRSLSAELRLPPGWRLLGATGVDRVPGSWLSRWNLFGFFVVLLTSLAAGRLLGPRWGGIALLTLALTYGEPSAPLVAWLAVAAAAALRRARREGRLAALARAAWVVCLVVLGLGLVPFVVDQIRTGLFPQLGEAPIARTGEVFFQARGGPAGVAAMRAPAEESVEVEGGVEGGVPGGVVGGEPQAMPMAPPPPRPAAEEKEADRLSALGSLGRADKPARKAAKRQMAPLSNLLGSSEQAQASAYQQDPHAVIQTGSGVPSWSWGRYALQWSGPVAADQSMRLYLLSPAVNRLLALLRVALAVLLAAGLVGLDLRRFAPPWRGAAAAAGAAGLAALLLAAAPARADENQAPETPGARLLEELRQRLTRAPACAPDCVDTARLDVSVSESSLRLGAEVHAGAATAWPIPGPAASWVPRSVSLDGQPAEGRLARLPNGFLHLRVPAGVHQVVVAGPLPPRDSVTLQLGETPRRARASAPGWQVDGIREDGSADDSIQLSRRVARAAGAAGDGSYEPWLEVTRVIEVGVSWNVVTRVRRVSPTGAPLVVKVPLLKGMLVTDAQRQVKDGEVLVTLGRDETEAEWAATLKPVEGEPIALKAPENKPWSEVWLVHCGPVWQCETKGIAPVARVSDGALAPEFRPWPGESVTLTLRRPKGIEGRTLTIDAAALALTPGIRLTDATLDVQVRASRSGPLALTLPAPAEIQELKVDGADRPIRPADGRIEVPVEAGRHALQVVWREAGGLSPFYRAPAVRLGQEAVNARVSIALPAERWLLWAHGPSWGPVVLFWPYFVAVLLAAALLARVPRSPLSLSEWLLLALGLTQIPAPAAALVAAWLLALAWRRDRVLARPAWHDLMQLGLALLTLVALALLYAAVRQGLLLRPEMAVDGGGSSDTLLRWYADRIDGALPRPWVASTPLWVYKLALLLWSLWLALRLVRWLPWAWACFSSGALWLPLPLRAARVTAVPKAAAPTTAEAAPAPPPQDPGSGAASG